MKNIFLVLLVLLLLTMVSGLIFKCKPSSPVREGQVWVYEPNIDNPFEESNKDTMEILEIKGEYVLYISHGIKRSCKKYLIPVDSRLIKSKQ